MLVQGMGKLLSGGLQLLPQSEAVQHHSILQRRRNESQPEHANLDGNSTKLIKNDKNTGDFHSPTHLGET